MRPAAVRWQPFQPDPLTWPADRDELRRRALLSTREAVWQHAICEDHAPLPCAEYARSRYRGLLLHEVADEFMANGGWLPAGSQVDGSVSLRAERYVMDGYGDGIRFAAAWEEPGRRSGQSVWRSLDGYSLEGGLHPLG